MRILGIDPGLARVGYGIIDHKTESMNMVDCGIIETKKEKNESNRLVEIYNDILELVDIWEPDCAVVEKFFFYKSSTTISVVQARGVIIMALALKSIPIYEYAPAQIKLVISGSGKANKNDILISVMEILKLDSPPKPDDATDALAIALTKIFSN